jgi:hypothetical protein
MFHPRLKLQSFNPSMQKGFFPVSSSFLKNDLSGSFEGTGKKANNNPTIEWGLSSFWGNT